ncbi:MAG: hypothetical protein EOP81_19260, partial [Variovorax sp.]
MNTIGYPRFRVAMCGAAVMTALLTLSGCASDGRAGMSFGGVSGVRPGGMDGGDGGGAPAENGGGGAAGGGVVGG